MLERASGLIRDQIEGWERWKRSLSVPGTPPQRAFLTLNAFGRDSIGFLRRAATEYGDFFICRFGVLDLYVAVDPALIEQILVKQHKKFIKDSFTRGLNELLGEGLVTSDGDLWKRQRKIIAPPLQRKHIAGYADDMVALTAAFVEDWRDGAEHELLEVMNQLTLKIVVKTLFGEDITEGFDVVRDSVEACMQYFQEEEQTLWRLVPHWLPTGRRRRFVEAVARVDAVLKGIIDRHRASSEEGHDLLSLLLRAVDEEGNGMSDEQLRDEAITAFLAGHETTALALTYTFDLLSKHPEVERALLQEVDEVLGGRAAVAEDTPKLKYAQAVVKEAMRLQPPVWTVGREALEDIQLGDFVLPKGSQVITPQCVVHRDARLFNEPNAFRPERWLDGSTEGSPRFAYFPFGGGPRVCIGNHFAMMESVLVLCTIAQRARLERLPPLDFEVLASVTTRPTTPLAVKIHRR